MCANAFERFGMFLTFCFTADASTIESLRLNQGSFKRASFQCIFNTTDVSPIKDANSQPTIDCPVDGDWIDVKVIGASTVPCISTVPPILTTRAGAESVKSLEYRYA